MRPAIRTRRRGNVVAKVVVACFLVADVLLVWAAFRHMDAPVVNNTASSTQVTDQPRSTPSSSAKPTSGSGSSGQSGQSGQIATESVLLGGSSTLLVKAARGTCIPGLQTRSSAKVTVSTDGGASFSTARLDPAPAAVLNIDTGSARRVTVLGAAGAKCRVQAYRSTNGKAWTTSAGNGLWHLAADPSSTQVFSPSGATLAPCSPIAISVVRNDIARILCGGGEMFRSPDDKTWSPLGTVRGATAIRFPTPYQGLALAKTGGCPATVLRSLDSGRTWTKRTCLRGGPGVALTGQSNRYVALIGDTVRTSADGGKTWKPARG